MAQTPKFTVQILEKIGAPLAAAIEAVPLKGDDTDIQSAKLMAQMLGQAVQISISLNGSLNVQEDEAQADSTRLALASLAAPLIADFYEQNENVPEDQDIKRIIKSLESVLAFADNFTAAEEGKSRLTTLDHDAPLFDKTQTTLVVIQVMIPVITAVAEFPFGQSETKLVQEIAAKLEVTAAEIAKTTQNQDKLSELMVLKALASLYAQCHRAQTQKLANTTPNENAEISLDPVWEAFETRTEMVKVVIGVGEQASQSSSSEAALAPPIAETPAASDGASPAPMNFFKKPDEGQAVAPAEVTNAQPVAAGSETPPAAQPESQPAAGSPPSSPMGFFKPGVKKSDDSDSSSGA